MSIDDKIKNEKLQYDIDRTTAKISILSSRKQHRIILEAKVSYTSC